MAKAENAESDKPDPFIGESILFSLVQQSIAAVLLGLVLDGGELFQRVAYASAAYWIGVFILVARRANRLTKVDRFLIRWGFWPLCIVSFFLTGWIWKLRGY